jgi:hypothetical protein
MKRLNSAGNVLIYVLIAVVLFAALSFALTKQLGNGGMTGTLDTNKARLRGEEMINYATAMRSTVEQMNTMSNVLPQEFSFLTQADAAYATDRHTPQVFHPAGGGMNTFSASTEMFATGSAKRGWVAQTGTNVEWTKTSGSDVIYTFLDVSPAICAAINERLFKSTNIPVTTLDPNKIFIQGGADDADFTSAMCTDCVQKTSMCVQASDGTDAFYNIILAR